jgi:hypothetical protein
MDDMVESLKSKKKIRYEVYSPIIGFKRFSAEHWVHTHPDVIPCDVYGGNYTWGYDNLVPTENMESQPLILKKAPRFSGEAYVRPSLKQINFLVTKKHIIYELEFLYGKKPSNTSWFWKAYCNCQ